MSRSPVLTDEQILDRARSVFVESGFGARTKQTAAAVGLTWGAIVLRIDDKRSLFAREMTGPVLSPGELACELAGSPELRHLLERLRSHLWERWPWRLQVRLAMKTASPDDEPASLLDTLAVVVEAHTRPGAVRNDISARTLAQLVLALLVRDVAQRFAAREPTSPHDPAFIDCVAVLISTPGPSWTGCKR